MAFCPFSSCLLASDRLHSTLTVPDFRFSRRSDIDFWDLHYKVGTVKMYVFRRLLVFLTILALALSMTTTVDARSSFNTKKGASLFKPTATTDANPNSQFEVHNIGKISMIINNYGTFGFGYVANPVVDGEEARGCEYPVNSNLEYLFAGAVWIGSLEISSPAIVPALR